MRTDILEKAFQIIDDPNMGTMVYGNIPNETIVGLENILDLRFPDAFKLFLSRYGAIKVGPHTFFGICLPHDQEPSIVWALQGLRAIYSDMPNNLIPIHPVEDSGLLACLWCQDPSTAHNSSAVYLWNPTAPLSAQDTHPVSQNFEEYLYQQLLEWKHRVTGLRTMERHVQYFEEEYLKVGKIPRNHIWRPQRFCVQDIVLGLVVVRHSLERNCLEVDVCLTSDVPDYEAGSGAKMTSAFLLSEAYKCGGTMEIRFTDNVENGNVPFSLRKLAQSLGVVLDHSNEGRIAPSEARELYVAITDFSPTLKTYVDVLAKKGLVSQESICFAVHSGIWTVPEVEMLVYGSQRPNSIFTGQVLPEQRHLYMHDIVHSRSAILGGFLDKKLLRRERLDGQAAIDLEDDVRRVTISFDATIYAKNYRCDEGLPIPWLADKHELEVLSPGQTMTVLIRARDASELSFHLEQDISLAGHYKSYLSGETSNKVFVLVPRDFEQLAITDQQNLVQRARAKDVDILICPETVFSLDAAATSRIASSRILRQ